MSLRNLIPPQKPSLRELIPYMAQDEGEHAYLTDLADREEAAPGVTIFVHRLSPAGYYLCTVPCPHPRSVDNQNIPPRFCGCPTCQDKRAQVRDLMAWVVSPTAVGLHQVWERMQKEKDDAADQI